MLRNFPGDTSLPGGRYEPGDRTLEDTAVSVVGTINRPLTLCTFSIQRREAFEEVCLIDRRF